MPQTAASPSTLSPLSAATALTGPIVAAVGGSDWAGVLRAARLLSSHEGNGVLALSVLEPLPVYAAGIEPVFMPPNFEPERHASLAKRIEELVEEVAGDDATWRSRVVDGEPPFVLAALAQSLHAPLIVMGIGRHRPVDRILGAETSLRTIRRAPCPVLAVHGDLHELPRQAVLATDFSPASAHAARSAIPLLAEHATLHLVHVWNPAATEDTRLGEADAAYANALPDRFRRFAELLPARDGLTIKTATREGKPAERILEYAEAHHADLIVAGRQGLNPLRRLLVGSVTSAIVRGATTSVLVAPEPPFVEKDRLRLLLSGATESTDPAEWGAQLAAFTERNRGRPAIVEIDDVRSGAQVVESGYVLASVAYDAKARRAELSVGDPDRAARHVTRAIGVVESVAIAADAHGRDVGLRISHGGGQTVVTFSGDER